MFQVVTIEDRAVRVLPHCLALSRLEAITQHLELTYIDKVIPDLGVGVTLYEILDIQGGTVYPLEGAAMFKVTFSLVVFRPFVGEVMTGRIVSSDRRGLQISLGFFDDVFIPSTALQEPSVFDEAEPTWRWMYEGNVLFMDVDEEVRFRVKQLHFPPRPISAEDLSRLKPLDGGMPGPAFAPMVVEGDMNSEGGVGLGLLAWWQTAAAGGDMAVDDAQAGCEQ